MNTIDQINLGKNIMTLKKIPQKRKKPDTIHRQRGQSINKGH